MSTSPPEKLNKHLLPCHVRLLDGTDLYIQLPVSEATTVGGGGGDKQQNDLIIQDVGKRSPPFVTRKIFQCLSEETSTTTSWPFRAHFDH